MVARKSAGSKSPPPSQRPLLQWLVAGLGAAVTLGVIGIVVWEALSPPSPPALTARIVGVSRTHLGEVAEVEVSNAGDDTASAVTLIGQTATETATVTLDYVPGHGQATAHLRFDQDAAVAAVSVSGWSEP